VKVDSISSINIGFLSVKNDKNIKYLESKLMFLLACASMNGNADALKLLNSARRLIYSGNIQEVEKLINEAERKLLNFKRSNNAKDTKERLNNNNGEEKITLVDVSSDPSVSFKYPASVPVDSAFIFITSHENQHVQDILGRAILEGRIAQVYVRYFTSYDSKGRLIFTGGYTWGKITDYRA